MLREDPSFKHVPKKLPNGMALANRGFVARTRRAAGYTVTVMTMQRLRTVAQPLIAALSDEQKDAGRGVLQAMGVSF